MKEDQAYKVLETDEERAAFIETFWAALDPTPWTEANERRVEFWKRVDDANRMIREAMKPISSRRRSSTVSAATSTR